MKALIIAAGNGTRMQPVTQGQHKSLMPLLGLKIIERIILGAKEAGIYEFVIVTGYKGEELRGFLGDGARYGTTLSYIHNNKWKKANGISVVAAQKYFNENFVLLMSDHVFTPKTLIRIKRLKLKTHECVLAIDKNLDSVLDVKDTTKVTVKNGKAIALNKNLESYNAYDTGMFVCSPYIFKVLEKTIKHGKNSLSDGMRMLITEGNLRILDNKGNFWADCDTWKDIKFAEKKLLKSLIKPKDGMISKNLNRRVSTFITRFLIKTPLTPNMITFAIPTLFGIPTFFLLAQGTYPWILFGGIMIQFMSIIDGVDGEISRLKYLGSVWGKWLDPIADRYVDTIVIAGMAYGYWRITGNANIIPVLAFVMLSELFSDYLASKFESQTGRKLKFSGVEFKRDIRLLVLAVGAITNQIFLTFIIFITISQLKFAGQIIAGRRIAQNITNTKKS